MSAEPRRVCVGREAELRTLARRLAEARDGRGSLVTLVGEPGIGKTRTVEEVLARGAVPAARVLWGRCQEHEGAPAYWPWVQALRGWVERAEPRELRAALGPAGGDVARILPAVRERLPDVVPSAVADHEHARFQLFDGIATFLRRAAPLRSPGAEIHALQLGGVEQHSLGDAGELIDADARAAYKERLQDLTEELEHAEHSDDVDHATRAESEIDALTRELARATGLAGRTRKAGSPRRTRPPERNEKPRQRHQEDHRQAPYPRRAPSSLHPHGTLLLVRTGSATPDTMDAVDEMRWMRAERAIPLS
jgi:AAA ATPase domain